MKWIVIVVAGLVGASSGAAVAAECDDGTGTLLKLSNWSATSGENGLVRLALDYENATAKGIKMVDATVWFDDALGGEIGGAQLDRDPKLAPGSSKSEAKNMAGFDRLVKADKADVNAILCVRAVLYEDGTKEEF